MTVAGLISVLQDFDPAAVVWIASANQTDGGADLITIDLARALTGTDIHGCFVAATGDAAPQVARDVILE